LRFDPGACEIQLINPCLPSFIEEVTLRNIRLGGSSVDFAVRRHGSEASLEILRRRGKIQVSVVFS
jgi:hypothetical protein